MMIDVNDLIEEYEKDRLKLLTGLANPGKDHEQTQLERGKFAELTRIVNGLRERAADFDSR